MSTITTETIPKITASAQAVISALLDRYGPRGTPVAMLMTRDVALALAVSLDEFRHLPINGGNELAGVPAVFVPGLRGIHALLPDGSTALVWP